MDFGFAIAMLESPAAARRSLRAGHDACCAESSRSPEHVFPGPSARGRSSRVQSRTTREGLGRSSRARSRLHRQARRTPRRYPAIVCRGGSCSNLNRRIGILDHQACSGADQVSDPWVGPGARTREQDVGWKGRFFLQRVGKIGRLEADADGGIADLRRHGLGIGNQRGSPIDSACFDRREPQRTGLANGTEKQRAIRAVGIDDAHGAAVFGTQDVERRDDCGPAPIAAMLAGRGPGVRLALVPRDLRTGCTMCSARLVMPDSRRAGRPALPPWGQLSPRAGPGQTTPMPPSAYSSA